MNENDKDGNCNDGNYNLNLINEKNLKEQVLAMYSKYHLGNDDIKIKRISVKKTGKKKRKKKNKGGKKGKSGKLVNNYNGNFEIEMLFEHWEDRDTAQKMCPNFVSEALGLECPVFIKQETPFIILPKWKKISQVTRHFVVVFKISLPIGKGIGVPNISDENLIDAIIDKCKEFEDLSQSISIQFTIKSKTDENEKIEEKEKDKEKKNDAQMREIAVNFASYDVS